MNTFAKFGSVAYVAWGLLHLEAARRVYMLGQSIDPGMIQGRIYQDAWGLIFFAVFSIVVAIYLNWRNSHLGYWLNLVVVSVADLGYIFFIMLPGYVPVIPGILGPLLWLLALMFSTLAIVKDRP